MLIFDWCLPVVAIFEFVDDFEGQWKLVRDLQGVTSRSVDPKERPSLHRIAADWGSSRVPIDLKVSGDITGVGGTFGAFIGAALMETIRNSLLMAGIDPYWQGTFLGLFIVGAVWLEKVKNKKN